MNSSTPWAQPSVSAIPAVAASWWASQLSGPGRMAAARMITLTAPGNRTASFQARFPTAGSMSTVKHVMNILLSPVVPEGRYLLVASAALLALSFAGWVAALEPLRRRGVMGARIVPALAVVFTLSIAAAHPSGR